MRKKRETLREQYERKAKDIASGFSDQIIQLQAELAHHQQELEKRDKTNKKLQWEYERLAATYNALQAHAVKFDPTELELLGYSAQAVANHLYRLYKVTGREH